MEKGLTGFILGMIQALLTIAEKKSKTDNVWQKVKKMFLNQHSISRFVSRLKINVLLRFNIRGIYWTEEKCIQLMEIMSMDGLTIKVLWRELEELMLTSY
jgi:hypothetical protein